MMRSARTSAAVRYALFFITVISGVAAVLYTLIRINAYSRLDQSLNSVLGVATLTTLHEIQEHGGKERGEESIRIVLNTMYSASFPQEQIVIREGDRMVAYKPNLGVKQIDLRTVQPPAGQDRFDFEDLRVVIKRLPSPEASTTYSLMVSTWRGDVRNDLKSALLALEITIPLSFLFAVVGGYLLALRTLAPLSEMSSTIDTITSKNLDLRVRIANPRDEVGQLAIRFNHLLDRLQETFLQQRRFMADASHELKTPIAAALTAAQVTLQGVSRTEEEHREALQIVEEQMLRLRRIVQDMFLLAQADSRDFERRPELVYLDEMVAEACRAMRMLFEKKGVHLDCGELPEMLCSGDPDLLRQALIILLDNACKYTSAGGSANVTLEQTDQFCVVRVSDTGQGIPSEAQRFIFDRFYRADPARSRSSADANGSGAGLGLSIAQWIVKIHDGTLRLAKSTSDGSVFVMEIPKVIRREHQERKPSGGDLSVTPLEKVAEKSR